MAIVGLEVLKSLNFLFEGVSQKIIMKEGFEIAHTLATQKDKWKFTSQRIKALNYISSDTSLISSTTMAHFFWRNVSV